MKRQPQSIHALLNNSNALTRLQRHSQQLQQLAETVRRCLPSTASRHLLSCSYNGSTLTLYAQGPAQATALRLVSHDLLCSMSQQPSTERLPSFSTLRIRISLVQHTSARQNKPPILLTASTATLVSELAETVIDPSIQVILRRLSRRGKNAQPD